MRPVTPAEWEQEAEAAYYENGAHLEDPSERNKEAWTESWLEGHGRLSDGTTIE